MKNRDILVDEVDCIPSSEYPNAPNYGYHDFYEIEVYLSGKGLHYLNAIPYEVTRGYAYLLLPGDFHRYEIDADEKILDKLMEYSPLVRNRVTLMRLRRAMEI